MKWIRWYLWERPYLPYIAVLMVLGSVALIIAVLAFLSSCVSTVPDHAQAPNVLALPSCVERQDQIVQIVSTSNGTIVNVVYWCDGQLQSTIR